MNAATKTRNLLPGVLAAALCALPAMAQSDSSAMSAMSNSSSTSLTSSDRQFIRKAAEGGMAEVELGQLAQEKGSSEAVKNFGKRMVDDHTKANDQLKQLASNKGVEVPQDLNAKDKMLKASLSKLSGDQFDKAYMKDMVKDHTADVQEFRKESTSAQDPDVKHFASETLPTLQDHLKEAQNINSEKMGYSK
jgi:putative membrane protein